MAEAEHDPGACLSRALHVWAEGETLSLVKTILNIIWFVLAGVWLALGYVLAAVLLAITIIGIPFAAQSLKLAGYALWPFGRSLVQSPTRHKGISVIGNVLWLVFGGWWLALLHLLVGARQTAHRDLRLEADG